MEYYLICFAHKHRFRVLSKCEVIIRQKLEKNKILIT